MPLGLLPEALHRPNLDSFVRLEGGDHTAKKYDGRNRHYDQVVEVAESVRNALHGDELQRVEAHEIEPFKEACMGRVGPVVLH